MCMPTPPPGPNTHPCTLPPAPHPFPLHFQLAPTPQHMPHPFFPVYLPPASTMLNYSAAQADVEGRWGCTICLALLRDLNLQPRPAPQQLPVLHWHCLCHP